jgi:hypothetical protein
LGGGSPNDLAPALKAWKESVASAVSEFAKSPSLPVPIAELAQELWQRAIISASVELKGGAAARAHQAQGDEAEALRAQVTLKRQCGGHSTRRRFGLITFTSIGSRVSGSTYQWISERRWGIMPASSFERGDGDKIGLLFQPLALPGDALQASGPMLRIKQAIATQDRTHQVKDQIFIVSDGTGTAWLAHRYAYTRRHG